MSGGDPHHRVAHRANRQFNRQNPAFANRPTPGHFDHTSKWPVPQRWSAAGPENVMPKLPYAEDANGKESAAASAREAMGAVSSLDDVQRKVDALGARVRAMRETMMGR